MKQNEVDQPLTDNDKQRIKEEAIKKGLAWNDFIKGAEYATIYERQEQANESFYEYKKNCSHRCGNSPVERHTCGCYSDWLQNLSEQKELASLRSENEKLKELLKLKDEYIEVIAKSESGFAVFCNAHGISVDKNLARRAQELRDSIASLVIKAALNPTNP